MKKRKPAPVAGKKNAGENSRQTIAVSVFLALLALVSITAATAAWFTIADSTRLKSMNMEITSGANLRFDLDAHPDFDDYVKTLSFEAIADRIRRDQGFDMREVPLEPVTTANYTTFTLENGTVVEKRKGAYLEFVLHFMALEDMTVHLSSENSSGKKDGTAVSSENASLPEAMRISFTAGNKTMVYDPGMGDSGSASGNTGIFGLPAPQNMVYSARNALFDLKKDTDQAVVVHVWLEGTDAACTNDLKGADYSIQLRFVGTDKDGNVLDGS